MLRPLNLLNAAALICSLFSMNVHSQSIKGLSSDMEATLRECAPNVHPETMAAVVKAESGGNQYAIADAGPVHLPWSQRKSMVRSFYFPTISDAVLKAQNLIAAGHTVSLGPAQINDRNLPRLGLSIEQVFDTCTNIRAGGRILGECYDRATKKFGAGQKALRAALSCYNSGDMERGEKDGYVDLVFNQVGKPLVLKASTSKSAAPANTVVALSSVGPWWKTAGKASPPRKGQDFTLSAKEFTVTAE